MTIAYSPPEARPSGRHTPLAELQARLAAQPTKLWHRLALAAILFLATFATFFQITINGYSNTYYAAAVRSMLTSWHNFFFVSFDPGGFVTVDKPPLGLWFEALSAKLLGFSGFSIMLPQALAGLLCIPIMYYLVRRWFGPIAGLITALVLAFMPISLVMSRNNNQDMMMVFFLVLGAWAVILSVERGKLRWLLLSALALGLAFNVKALEAYLAVPAFGLAYLLGAPISWPKRILHLVLAFLLLLVVSFSWMAVVDMTPASQRPYVDSSQDNSEISLTIGYNGIQRLLGMGFNRGNTQTQSTQSTSANRTSSGSNSSSSTSGTSSKTTTSSSGSSTTREFGNRDGGFGAGGPGGGFSNGAAGPLRMFDADLGGQASWFLPLALIALVGLAWQTQLRFPLSRSHQALVVWGGWLLTNYVFFSVANFFHPYYMVIIAPAIAALSGIGVVVFWQSYRDGRALNWRTWMLPVSLLFTAAGQVYILTSYSSWTFLTPLVLVVSLLVALMLVVAKFVPRLNEAVVALPKIALTLALVSLLTAPGIWSYVSDMSSIGGSMPSAGPAAARGQFANFGGNGQRSFDGELPQGFPGAENTQGGFPGGQSPSGGMSGNNGQPPTGAMPGGSSTGAGGQSSSSSATSTNRARMGGGDVSVNTALLKYLEANQGATTYLFATQSSMTAAPYIIQTGKAVMALGGFSGSDPILTAQSVASLVKSNTVRFFLIGGGMGGPGGGSSGVTSWVQSNCKLVSSSQWSSSSPSTAGFGGNEQLYDCASAK